MTDLQFFDPKQEVTVVNKSLPHWAQDGTICFITWRTADSLPAVVVKRIAQERAEILRNLGLNLGGNWKRELGKLSADKRSRVQWQFFNAWDHHLDCGAGECALARPEFSRLVEESLLYFDGDRYLLTDAVVMPNHVHLLVAFRDAQILLSQCTSWKRYTGVRIQAALGRHGEFWQVEQFDHLVRNAEQFEYFRRYIADNPIKARLELGTYRCYSKKL